MEVPGLRCLANLACCGGAFCKRKSVLQILLLGACMSCRIYQPGAAACDTCLTVSVMLTAHAGPSIHSCKCAGLGTQ